MGEPKQRLKLQEGTILGQTLEKLARRARRAHWDIRRGISGNLISEHRKGRAIRRRQDGAGRGKVIQKTSPEIGGMGHSIKRKEDLRFIRGKGNYVDDVHLPDMVYGHMVRSPLCDFRCGSGS